MSEALSSYAETLFTSAAARVKHNFQAAYEAVTSRVQVKLRECLRAGHSAVECHRKYEYTIPPRFVLNSNTVNLCIQKAIVSDKQYKNLEKCAKQFEAQAEKAISLMQQDFDTKFKT